MIETDIDSDDASGETVPHLKSSTELSSSSTREEKKADETAPTTPKPPYATMQADDPAKSSPLSKASPPTTPQQDRASHDGNNSTKGTPSSTKGKLRRKMSVEESIDNAVAIQRLVEYFLVISCRPRWEKNSNWNQNRGTTDAPASPKSVGRKPVNKDTNDEYTKTGTDHALNHTLPLDHIHDKDESREDPSMSSETASLAPPKPRETWNRDEGLENIHAPGTTNEETEYSHSFAPKVTARFPSEDHSDHPLNPMVTQFCFPDGDEVYPTTEYTMPSVHHFVMTNEKGRKVYGTCLTIYEEYHPPENTPWEQSPIYPTTIGETGIEVGVNTQENQLYIPRCLCILSIWSYVTAFREYLAQLYRLATSTDCMKAPIERYVMNLCMEIPAPPPGSFEVKISILDSVIRFWSPPAKLPIAYVALPYQTLFDCLDIENIIHLWYCLTMERKVLLVSSQNSILTVCSEILCSLLYPMKWSHLYVPLLPKFLCPILDAPVPYLCGVSRDNWISVQKFVSDETIVVDLDRNSVMFGQRTMDLPPVPGKKWHKLYHSLRDIAGHLFWRGRGLETEYNEFVENKISHKKFEEIAKEKGEQVWKEKLSTLDQAFNLQYTPDSENLLNYEGIDDKKQNQWDRLQEAFLRFFVALLKDYRKFLYVPDTSKLGSLSPSSDDWLHWGKNHKFEADKFIASQKPEYYSYLSELCMTQQFDDFITKRLYSPELPDVIFFDQSIDAKLNRYRLKLNKVHTPFLQSAQAHKQLQTFVAVEPNSFDLPDEAPFIYDTWPEKFDNSLFCSPRPIPSMITAEFDRQTSLMKRLQMNYAPSVNKSAELANLYGSDYDYSPEGMSFTVFFYAYSAVIGREWQEYQLKRREMENNAQLDEKVEEGRDQAVEASPFDEERADLSQPNLMLDVCDDVGVVCPYGRKTVDDAVNYVSNSNPCPDINSSAQVAYDTLSDFALSLDPANGCRNTSSLLDDDQGFAEYEEAREVAIAQLDLAFDALRLMESRGLTTDPDVFKSLMESCGRCGDTKRALELIELMKREGLVADHDVLLYFMASFAQNSTHDGEFPSGGNLKTQDGSSDAYSQFLKKKLLNTRDSQGNFYNLPMATDDDSYFSDGLSDSGSEHSTDISSSSILQLFAAHTTQPKKKKKKRKRKKNASKNLKDDLSDRMRKQLVLGESLLDFLYPDIYIDTFGDACPSCSCVMKEEDIVSGWKQCDFQDFTTACPQCGHRFVPRFKVSCSSHTFEGSQGPGTPLYCEFLSPWVLRKELGHIIGESKSITQILDPSWRSGRDVRATIWWNLIAMFKRYQLPYSFLLQGSFRNRLINPSPQDD